MAFRKRNVGLNSPGSRVSPSPTANKPSQSDYEVAAKSLAVPIPGLRASPLDGRSTTSTGTQSLDGLLAGHAGLVLGSSILIEEIGTTDYGSILLRYYAAEGVVQGHRVHVVGVPEQWGRELPGTVSSAYEKPDRKSREDSERMKIAYRYERLGEFGADTSRGGAFQQPDIFPSLKHAPGLSEAVHMGASTATFCHSFDLTKRLMAPSTIHAVAVGPRSPNQSPFRDVLGQISREIESTAATVVHRIVIPSFLSPAIFPPWASNPRHALQFLHGLRALLHRHRDRLTAMLSLSLALHSRQTGLTRWVEMLCDGVIELIPFPHTLDPGPSLSTAGAATAHEDQPQGIVKIHRQPIFHERGGGSVGGAGVDDDLAFTSSRRHFRIQPFRLPPMDEEGEDSDRKKDTTGQATKVKLEF